MDGVAFHDPIQIFTFVFTYNHRAQEEKRDGRLG